MSLKSAFKGWSGEAWTRFAMWIVFNSKTYRRIHNLIIEDSRGSTQIDAIMVSRYGIFVFEVKNMQGWIFGSEHDKTWTQKFPRASYKFRNPLRQNYRHKMAVAEHLGIDPDTVFPVVFFGPWAEFKSTPPEEGYAEGVRSYLNRYKTVIFTDDQVQEFEKRLRMAKANQISARQHVSNLKQRHESDDCPHCGSKLVQRNGKYGAFIGCTAYPECRYTRNAR